MAELMAELMAEASSSLSPARVWYSAATSSGGMPALSKFAIEAVSPASALSPSPSLRAANADFNTLRSSSPIVPDGAIPEEVPTLLRVLLEDMVLLDMVLPLVPLPVVFTRSATMKDDPCAGMGLEDVNMGSDDARAGIGSRATLRERTAAAKHDVPEGSHDKHLCLTVTSSDVSLSGVTCCSLGHCGLFTDDVDTTPCRGPKPTQIGRKATATDWSRILGRKWSTSSSSQVSKHTKCATTSRLIVTS